MADIAAVTNVVIEATDDTRGAFARVNEGLNSISGAARGLKTQLGGIASALGVGLFASMVKDAIDAAAALDDLAERTGASVESLSKFAGVARITGQDMGSVEQAMAKLSKSINEAQDSTSRQAEAFRAFGVSIRNANGTLRNAGDVMAELATKQQGFADGAGKVAAGAELMGRNFDTLLPFLNDYVRLSDEIGITTAEQAAESEMLNIQLGLMTESWNRLLREAILPLVPQIRGLIEDVRSLGRALSETMPTENPFSLFLDSLRDTIRRTAGEIAYIKQAWENLKTWWSGGTPTVTPEAAYNAAYLAEQNKALARTTRELAPLMDAASSSAEKMGVKFAASGSAAKGATKETEGYREEMRRLKTQLDAEAKSLEAYIKLWEGYEKDAAKFAADRAKATEDDALAREESIRSIIEQVNALEEEARQIGLSNEERERSVMLLKLENSGLDANSAEYQDLAKRIAEATDAKRLFNENKALADEFQRQADSITQSLTDALLRGFESGKDFAENFVATLKNMFSTLVLRPIIQAIVAPIAGGIGGMFPGSAGASGFGGGGGFNLSSLFGGGSSLGSYAAGGWSSLFGASDFSAALAGDAFLPGALGASGLGTVGAGSIIGSALGSIGAALPYVAVAYAIYSMFRKPRGGPKSGGFAQVGMPDLERFFTPNDKDADLQGIVAAQQQAYDRLISALGGTGSAGFAFGYDTDPRGTASDRIRAGVSVNGQLLYDTGNIETGRDSAATQAALELEAKRALLAALQASDLPQDIATILDSVTAATADAGQIDDILAVATALGSVYELFNSDVLEDGLTAYEDSLLGVNQALFRQINAVNELVGEYDGSAEAATELAAATQGVYASAVQAVAQINALRAQLSDMFAGSATNYRLAGMDNAGQRDYLQTEIARLAELLRGSTDAAAIQRYAVQINQNQQRLWSLLSPEEQRASAESFAQAAENAATLVSQRLTDAQNSIQSAIETTLTGVRELFKPVGETQQNSANDMRAAAADMLLAARTPLRVQIPELGGYQVNGG